MWNLDYEQILAKCGGDNYESKATAIAEELPYVWLDVYRCNSPSTSNPHRITIDTFEYLIDWQIESVEHGLVAPDEAVEERVFAVHGRSQCPSKKRNDAIMRNRPLGPVDELKHRFHTKYDKGHFIAHSIGGGLDINIFPQHRKVNRGWSARGKVWRAMERYCQRHGGVYCFSRPIYLGRSWHPQALDYGVLKLDGTLWVERFKNCGSSKELKEIERLAGDAISTYYRR